MCDIDRADGHLTNALPYDKAHGICIIYNNIIINGGVKISICGSCSFSNIGPIG